MVKSSTIGLLYNEKTFVKNLTYTGQFSQMMKMIWCYESEIDQIQLVAQEECNVFDEIVYALSIESKI